MTNRQICAPSDAAHSVPAAGLFGACPNDLRFTAGVMGSERLDCAITLIDLMSLSVNCFGFSKTYREVLELDDWIRRRVRLYYWTALPR